MILFQKIKHGLAEALSVLLVSAVLLSGCAGRAEAENTGTPEPTAFIRTSYEVPGDEYIQAEMEKLCIIDDDTKYIDYLFIYLLFEKNGKQISMCVTMPNFESTKDVITVKDAFTDADLFSFSAKDPGFVEDPNVTHTYAENLKNINPINPYFEDAIILKLDTIWYYWYYDITKQYVSRDDLKGFYKELLGSDDLSSLYGTGEHSHTRSEIAYFYVKYLPEEYRVNAYDYHPELQQARPYTDP